MSVNGVRRLAMWSGPRNLSTALMRAWGSRDDTLVCDEPFYGVYLAATGAAHPGREEIVARCETDWRRVARELCRAPLPAGRRIHYQKHMAHHLLPEIERPLLAGLCHGFLIRDPARMLASLDRVTPDPALADTGLVQQLELFRAACAEDGRVPPVLDAADLLADPERSLRRLCEAWEVPFDPAMLGWEPGPRPTDGIWAPHWYASVERTTGFRPPSGEADPLPERLRPLLERCLPPYEELHARRL